MMIKKIFRKLLPTFKNYKNKIRSQTPINMNKMNRSLRMWSFVPMVAPQKI